MNDVTAKAQQLIDRLTELRRVGPKSYSTQAEVLIEARWASSSNPGMKVIIPFRELRDLVIRAEMA